MGYPFTGWRPPVPSGPLYSRKRTSHAPRPCELGQCIENDRGWKPFPQISRQAWIEPPQNRDHDGRGLCAGGTFAGIKRTEGSHPAKVSPARRTRADNQKPITNMKLKSDPDFLNMKLKSDPDFLNLPWGGESE